MRKLVNKFCLVGLVVGLSLTAVGRDLSRPHTKLIDYLTSGDFSCTVLSKKVLKPGSVSANPNIIGTEPVCFMGVSCVPVPGVEAKVSVSHESCRAPKGVCMELLDCARERGLPKSTSDGPKWTVLPIAPKDAASNKFGDKCYRFSRSEKHGVYQFYDGKDVAEQVCVGRYTCDGQPAGSSVACSPVSSTVDGAKQSVCPGINDCINNEIPMPEGHSEFELKRLADKNPEKEKTVRAELAAPAVVAVAPAGNTVSMVTPSSQSYQSRTASIAGSRASSTTSAPPASAPPASGHTGRGMK